MAEREEPAHEPEPGYTAEGLRDYTPRPDVFVLYRRDDDGCEKVVDLFSRERLAEDVRDEACELEDDDPSRYRIERRRVYIGMLSL